MSARLNADFLFFSRLIFRMMIKHKKCFVLFVLFVLLVAQLSVFELEFVPTVNAADTTDYVDNSTSNVDGVANKGTHSNFTAMQYGPDGIAVKLLCVPL